jgi:DNA-binding NarL/FixJ family response regulator
LRQDVRGDQHLSASFSERQQMNGLRLLIADDHEIVREGLRSLLELQGWKVVAEAVNGLEAVQKAKETNPDIAIIDIKMPQLDGIETARQILKNCNGTKVLMLTMHDSDSIVKKAWEIGAHGYVWKADSSKEVVAAINALSQDKPFFSSNILDNVLNKRKPIE